MRIAILLSVLLTACLEAPPDTTTDEQSLCTIQDQAQGNCPGQEGCTPLDYCTDANFQNGSCCLHFNHPASPSVVGQVTCGVEPGDEHDQPICISQNKYDFGLVKVSCVTVTRWYQTPDHQVFSQSETECTIDP